MSETAPHPPSLPEPGSANAQRGSPAADAPAIPMLPSSRIPRIFTKNREPSWRQLWFYIAIVAVLVLVAFVPAGSLHTKLGLQHWRGYSNGTNGELSSAMLWLLAANVVSFLAVLLLGVELWHLKTKVEGMSFQLDRSAVTSRVRWVRDPGSIENPAHWALRPLTVTFVISLVSLALTVGLAVLFSAVHPSVNHKTFVVLVLFTGIVYIGLMTVGDLAARAAYRRATCLRPEWPATITMERKQSTLAAFDELVDALSDYERIVKYVDAPILVSLGLVMLHKYLVVHDATPYQLGFVAGTVAMHTILANVVSIAIAASGNQVETDLIA